MKVLEVLCPKILENCIEVTSCTAWCKVWVFCVNKGKSLKYAVPLFFSLADFWIRVSYIYTGLWDLHLKYSLLMSNIASTSTERTDRLCLYMEELGAKQRCGAQWSLDVCNYWILQADLTLLLLLLHITVVVLLNYITFHSGAVIYSSPCLCVPSFGPHCCRPVWWWWTGSILTACFVLAALPYPSLMENNEEKLLFWNLFCI